MLTWLLNRLLATGDVFENIVGEDALPFAIGERLGSGTFGRVHIATHSDETVAAKVLPKHVAIHDMNVLLPRSAAALREEVAIAKQLGGQHHCIMYMNVAETPDALYVYYELVPGGTLADRLQTAHREARRWAAQLLDAVAWCHENGIAHNDIKPENVLLTRAGPRSTATPNRVPETGADVRLCDWVLARRSSSETSAEITGFWSAPEILAGRCDDFFVADDWSAGLVVLAMCCGQPSETDVRELHRGGLAGAELFRAAVLKVQPLTHDVRVRALVARLLEPDPATRLSAEEALECEFVKGYA